MKVSRMIIVGLLFASAITSTGFSQSGSGSGGSSSTSTSTSNTTSAANVVVNTGSSRGGGFIEALPGATGNPGPFPGYTGENPACHLFWPAVERRLTMKQVRSMARTAHLKKHAMRVDIVTPDDIPQNNDPIGLADYNPKEIAYSGDEILASIVLPGKYLSSEEALLGVTLLKAKETTHTRRVAIIECPEEESVTKAHTVGLGGAFAETPGGGNAANGASLGFSFGASRSSRQEHEVFYVLAMNDGPTATPEQKPQKPSQEEAPTPPPPPAPAEPQTQQAPSPAAAAPPPPEPTPQPQMTEAPAPATTDACALPDFVVYFSFNRADVAPDGVKIKDKYGAEIERIATWLENNPACTIQVEGYASNEGSIDYNAGLGFNRAMRVYNLLIADCDSEARQRVVRAFSASKEFPSSEYQPKNRRVTIAVRSSASSK